MRRVLWWVAGFLVLGVPLTFGAVTPNSIVTMQTPTVGVVQFLQGTDNAGSPARFPAGINCPPFSASNGSSIFGATVGRVGATIASRSSNSLWNSSFNKLRILCAFR